jgi:hypothetical protein
MDSELAKKLDVEVPMNVEVWDGAPKIFIGSCLVYATHGFKKIVRVPL